MGASTAEVFMFPFSSADENERILDVARREGGAEGDLVEVLEIEEEHESEERHRHLALAQLYK